MALNQVSGAWVFRNTRLLVATVVENLEDLSTEEVMEQFDATREQISTVLGFVAPKPSGISTSATFLWQPMLILFDHETPKGLVRALPDHVIFTAQAKGAGSTCPWGTPGCRGTSGIPFIPHDRQKNPLPTELGRACRSYLGSKPS